MPPKRRSMRGAGFFGNLWNGVKKIAAPIKAVARLVPIPQVQAGVKVADAVGLGRKRKIKRGGGKKVAIRKF